MADAALSPKQLQDFAELVPKLTQVAPERQFAFRITITSEGERPIHKEIEQLIELLGRVKPELHSE